MLYAIIGILSILGYVNHKHSSALVALGPPAEDKNSPPDVFCLDIFVILKVVG